MENKDKGFTDNEEFRDTDQAFNARNQQSPSNDQQTEEGKQATNKDTNAETTNDENDAPDSPTDLEQDENGVLKSNN